MECAPRAYSPAYEGELRKLTYLRLVVATVVVGAAVVLLRQSDPAVPAGTLFGLLGVMYVSTALVYLACRMGATHRWLLWLQMFIDIAVLTLIIHVSGGSASFFSILFVFPVLIGGMYLQVGGGLTASVVVTAVYLTYCLLEYGGYIESPWTVLHDVHQNVYRMLLRVYLHMTVFVFAGCVSGYVSRHVKRTGEELVDREKEFRRIQLGTDCIIRNMSSGIIVTNMAGEILTLNPAAMSILGLEAIGTWQGKMIEDVIPHMAPLFTELTVALETETPRRRRELDVRRKDGSVLPLGVSISILRGDEGEKRGVIALFQDLTEVRRIVERIRQADKMAAVGELSAAIAHEIRAPLASICGSIEMLSSELELGGDSRRLMELVTKESERLDRIITDFLEYARMRKPEFGPVDVEQCINEIILLVRNSSSTSSDISMKVVSEVKGVRLYADEEQIKQVFLNIALNGCEAMNSGGSLTVSITKTVTAVREDQEAEECVWVDFRNNGPEIPASVLARVFEPFYTTKSGGTGLGLATAARIVESHGGFMRAVSSREEGTVFSVVLPVYHKILHANENNLEMEFISF